MSALVVTGAADVVIGYDVSAVTRRDSVLASASFVDGIATQEDLATAVEVFRELKAIAKATEDSRTAVKAPVLQLSRNIDTKAKEFVGSVELEIRRIDRLISDWNRKQEEERRKAEAERRRLLEEAGRREAARLRQIEEERLAKEREAAEAAKAAADVLGDSPAEAAQAAVVAVESVKQEAQQQIAQVLVESRAQRVEAITSTAAAIVPAKPAGLTTRKEPKFRVTDLLALAKKYPDWVTITPKTREIITDIRSAPEFGGEKEVYPGVIAWWEERAVVR